MGFRYAARIPDQHLRPRQRGRNDRDYLFYSAIYAHFSDPGIWTSIAAVIAVIVASLVPSKIDLTKERKNKQKNRILEPNKRTFTVMHTVHGSNGPDYMRCIRLLCFLVVVYYNG